MTQSHTLVSTSALESMDRMVRELQAERDMLLASAKLAAHSLNVSRPIDSRSVIPQNEHVHALNCIEKAIAACTESKQVMG